MIDLINLLILFVFGILYLFFFAKVLQRYFLAFGTVNRPLAVTILMLASVSSAAINLVHISELAANANRFFMGAGDYKMSLIFSFCFFTGMWLFSLALFHASFLITGWLSTENEKDELAKNNLELALLHSVILLALAFIISPPLIKIASGFIPYPKLPF